MSNLNWTKALNNGLHVGYTATGSSGRFYSILKHGTRFRFAGGGGKYDQLVGTLKDLKAKAEEVESAVIGFEQIVTNQELTVEPPAEVLAEATSLVTEAAVRIAAVDPVENTDPVTNIDPVGDDDFVNEPTPLEAGDFPVGTQQNPGPEPETDALAPTEFPVKTACGAILLVTAPDRTAAVALARADGFLVAGDDYDDDLGRRDIDWDAPGDPLPVSEPVVPVPFVNPDNDPDLDGDHIVLPPGSRPLSPEPDNHPDRETPLAPPEPVAPAGRVSYTVPSLYDSLPCTLDRLYLRRDLTWRPGAVIAPVRRYAPSRHR